MKIEEQNDALKAENRIALKRYEFAIKCLDRRTNKKIVDIGCGMGYGCQMLRDAGYKNVVGIDDNNTALLYANENYPGTYINRNIEDTEILGYDIGICLEVLCHLHKPGKFLDSLELEELIISAAIDPDPNDGYFYRIHNLSEKHFMGLLQKGGWLISDVLDQKKYMTIHATRFPIF